jgi:hypothetical protein
VYKSCIDKLVDGVVWRPDLVRSRQDARDIKSERSTKNGVCSDSGTLFNLHFRMTAEDMYRKSTVEWTVFAAFLS